MLQVDQDKRATAQEVLKNRYLSKYHNPSDEPVAYKFSQNYLGQDVATLIWKDLEHSRDRYVDTMPDLYKFSI
jgi:hypothetical protein